MSRTSSKSSKSPINILPSLKQLAATNIPPSQRHNVPLDMIDIEMKTAAQNMALADKKSSAMFDQQVAAMNLMAENRRKLLNLINSLVQVNDVKNFDEKTMDDLYVAFKTSVKGYNKSTVARNVSDSILSIHRAIKLEPVYKCAKTDCQTKDINKFFNKKENMILWLNYLEKYWQDYCSTIQRYQNANLYLGFFGALMKYIIHSKEFHSEADEIFTKSKDYTIRHMGIYRREGDNDIFRLVEKNINELPLSKAKALIFEFSEVLDRIGVFLSRFTSINFYNRHIFPITKLADTTPPLKFTEDHFFKNYLVHIAVFLTDTIHIKDNGVPVLKPPSSPDAYDNVTYLADYLKNGTKVIDGFSFWKYELMNNSKIVPEAPAPQAGGKRKGNK